MRLNAKELIANARVTAPTLPPATAKLMTDMADRLDVQFVALCESRNQVKQLASGIIPEGYVIVPEQMYLDAGDVESVCSQCGDGHENSYGNFTGAILWVGELSNDGEFKYGLNIASIECPEEGSVTICELDEQFRNQPASSDDYSAITRQFDQVKSSTGESQ
ncbi:hypothetical protein UYSO10_2701 [Kosakonia radicincitans]|uniref:hypothetical protein n=1 Tax=Kosakonia radicincitans TaxID=283686 RepID=UPI001183F144|nr:hypothetical protein [Kosakonia radicincitans]VVT49192.1 hypothetical protein UYSO10_2701 [Kosakonia radicincitans]